MLLTERSAAALSVAVLAVGFAVGGMMQPWASAQAQSGTRVFELRTYTTHEGKLPNLNARFRDHTARIFERHGMTNIAYWTPEDAPDSANTLIYVLAHASREAAKKSWATFRADPEWQKVRQESRGDGPIVSKVESVFMSATDYSPLQ